MNRKTKFETSFLFVFHFSRRRRRQKKVDLICMKINAFPHSSQSMFITGKKLMIKLFFEPMKIQEIKTDNDKNQQKQIGSRAHSNKDRIEFQLYLI